MTQDTTQSLDRLTAKLTAVVRDTLETGLAETEKEDVRLEDLERVTRQAIQQIGKQYLQLLMATCRPSDLPARILCRCGGQAEYVRERAGTVISWLGQVEVKRGYYLCSRCHHGTYPLDEQLGFRAGGLSKSLQEGAAMLGVHLPFEEGSEVFERLTQVALSDNAIRMATEQIGRERAKMDTQQVDAAWDAEEVALPSDPPDPPQRLYGSVDGTSVRTEDGWRKPKLGCWYTTESPPPQERPEDWQPQAEEIYYYADLASAEEFGRLSYVTGRQQGAAQASELVFVADGAPWIWELVAMHFPNAVEILDWYHAAEYVWDVAHTFYGQESPQAEAWTNECLDHLWHGEFEAVLDAFRAHRDDAEHADKARKALNYFTAHRHRMRYPDFRAQGYHIGSGTIESGCKRVIGARLKQAGMTWTEAGARQVIKARAMYLSHEWDTFCDQRSPLRRSYGQAA